MKDFAVSIILPIHSRFEYLEECVLSILEQTLKNIEVLCILDGECPTSKQVVDKYASDSFRIITKEKQGAWASRNLGIELARGEYVCFMDSDDYYASNDAVEKLYVKAKQNHALICGGNINMVFEDGRIVERGDVFERDGFENNTKRPQMYGHTAYLYKREFLITNNIKNEQLRRFEDPLFVIKAFFLAEKYYVTNEVVYNCRQYERSFCYDYETLIDILKGILTCTDYLCSVLYASCYEQHILGALLDIYEQYACFRVIEQSEVYQLTNMIARNMEKMGLNVPDIVKYESVEKYVEEVKRKLNLINQSEKIAIYGAGKVAKTLVELNIIDFNRIKKCYVSALKDNEASLCGIEVKSIDDLIADDNDLTIVAADGENAKEMEAVLVDFGIKRYIHLSSRELKSLYQLINIYEEQK